MRLNLPICATAMTALLAASAFAQPAAAPANAATQAKALRNLTLDEMTAARPAALKSGGRAQLSCTIGVDGAARDCTVKSETPQGLGVGAAALALVGKLTFRPATIDGAARDSVFSPVIEFPAPPRQVAAEPVREPTSEEFAAARPGDLISGGRAVLQCMIGLDGAPRDCLGKSETPRDVGVGPAALKLVGYMRFNPASVDGKPIESLRDITFVIPGEAVSTGMKTDGAGHAAVAARRIGNIPVSPADSTAAIVRIERDKHLVGILGVTIVDFDTDFLADVHNGEFIEFRAAPGLHILNVHSTQIEQRLLGLLPTEVETKHGLNLTLEPGHRYRFGLVADLNGVWTARPIPN